MLNRLIEARKSRGIMQKDLAEMLNLKRNTYNMIEGGKRSLTDRVISDACRVLDINEHWLRTGEGNMDAESRDELGIILDEFIKDKDTEFGALIASAMSTYHNAPPSVKKIIDEYIKSTLESYNKKSEA